MKNIHQGFAGPLLLIIIAVLVIGGGAYVYKNQTPAVNTDIQSTPTASNVTEQSETKYWRTYVNDKYGFSFAYPNAMRIGSLYGGGRFVQASSTSDEMSFYFPGDYTGVNIFVESAPYAKTELACLKMKATTAFKVARCLYPKSGDFARSDAYIQSQNPRFENIDGVNVLREDHAIHAVLSLDHDFYMFWVAPGYWQGYKLPAQQYAADVDKIVSSLKFTK